jgi:hypothetical protein
MNKKRKQRLAYLREQIKQECISYEEIAELQSLAEYIDDDDVLLKEWAEIPEGYKVVNRESEIDNLIMWISECGQEKASEKEMMKEDLKTLMSWTCEKIYSSESTNDYIEVK